jgi:hypothetical protein
MNDTAYFETYLYDPASGFKEWVGTADLDTLKRHRLAGDLRYPLYGAKNLGEWSYKAPEFSDRFN